MEYLIRFAQCHETFRHPELEALSSYEQVGLEIISYEPTSPFCTVRFVDRPTYTYSQTPLPSPLQPQPKSPLQRDASTLAKSFISRSILARGIYEVWGTGLDYASLHADVQARSKHLWHLYQKDTFKFSIDAFYGKRSNAQQRAIIDSFSYLGFKGKVAMKNPQVEFVVFEEWEPSDGHEIVQSGSSFAPGSRAEPSTGRGNDGGNGATAIVEPKRLFLGRYLGGSRRQLADKHDLKKRPYIATTSMDAELALVTANLALAGPGKLFMDPFVGTGGFMVAAAELGAVSLGSDIDGRSFRGKGSGLKKGVGANFKKYGIEKGFGDCLTCDLTNSPFRVGGYAHVNACEEGPDRAMNKRRKTAATGNGRWLDGIIADPPYGVREALKVLGMKVIVRPSVAAKAAAAAVAQSDPPQLQPTPSTDVPNNSAEHENLPSTPIFASTVTSHSTQPQPDTVTQKQTASIIKDHTKPYLIDGVPAHTLPGYIAPKKPYSFTLMLADILQFASITLVDGGRLAFWMPCADTVPESDPDLEPDENIIKPEDHAQESGGGTSDRAAEGAVVHFDIPTHPDLKLLHVCVQPFNRWSRRLLVYERVPDSTTLLAHQSKKGHGEDVNEIMQHLSLNGGVADAVDGDDLVDSGSGSGSKGTHECAKPTSTSTSIPATPPASNSSTPAGSTSISTSTSTIAGTGHRADDLNPFRRMYFQGFRKN